MPSSPRTRARQAASGETSAGRSFWALSSLDGSADAGIENPLLTRFKKALEDHRLSAREAVVWATPRRLVFWAKDVPPAQKEQVNRIRLLSKEEAYSADGNPTEIQAHPEVIEAYLGSEDDDDE